MGNWLSIVSKIGSKVDTFARAVVYYCTTACTISGAVFVCYGSISCGALLVRYGIFLPPRGLSLVNRFLLL